MSKRRIQKNSRVVFIGLLVTLLLAAGEGCADKALRRTPTEEPSPFYDDHIATVRIVMKDEDWSSCLTDAFAEQYVPADFWFDDELVPDVGVRPKGNSSLGQTIGWGSPRIPMAIDFNLFNRARTFRGLKKVFLNNGWSDPTLIREVIAYEVFAQMDIPTPRASIVDVWVNDTHLGVYTMAEAIDQTFISRHFTDVNGNLYKPDVMAARLNWTEIDNERWRASKFYVEPTEYNEDLIINLGGGRLLDILRALDEQESVVSYEPSPPVEGNIFRGLPPVRFPSDYVDAMALKTNENNPDYSALFHFLEILNNEPDETFMTEIEKVLDVDEVLRFLAASVCIVHLDNYIGIGHNNYLYEAKGKFHILPWDLNMAFGTFNCGFDRERLINYYIDEPTGGPVASYPLVNRLLSQQPYMDTYHRYLQELLDGPFAIDTIISRVDKFAELVRPYAEVDTEMFYSFSDCQRCLDEDLRPPDIFIGWMAGGATPQMPWLGLKESACLREKLGVNNPWELWTRELTPEVLKGIESCLTEKTYSLFLQNMFGPLKAPQPPRQPGFGPNAHGLKAFIIDRHKSIQEQLDGKRPSSAGDGSGNGAIYGMCAETITLIMPAPP